MATGTADTKLVVLRGNSGSGKSTTAKALRKRLGRGVAWVEQDYLRRIVLRERDVPGGDNIGLIDQTARYALDRGYHVILEGILLARRYGGMLRALHADHIGQSVFFYFDIPFEETARRHATRTEAAEFTVEDMRGWYQERDLLDHIDEDIVAPAWTMAETVEQIMTRADFVPAGADTDVAAGAARTADMAGRWPTTGGHRMR